MSLRIKLDDVIKSSEIETKILENIRYCNKVVGSRFRIIFWNENLTSEECKNFIERNEKLLFEVHTQITKGPVDTWFIIYSPSEKINCRTRYRVEDDDILSGISRYLNIIKHIQKREKDER